MKFQLPHPFFFNTDNAPKKSANILLLKVPLVQKPTSLRIAQVKEETQWKGNEENHLPRLIQNQLVIIIIGIFSIRHCSLNRCLIFKETVVLCHGGRVKQKLILLLSNQLMKVELPL